MSLVYTSYLRNFSENIQIVVIVISCTQHPGSVPILSAGVDTHKELQELEDSLVR